MTEALLRLVRDLRRHDVPVSLAESEDAAKCLGILPLHDRRVVRAALRSCLVKDASHATRFDALFAKHFDTRLPSRKEPKGKTGSSMRGGATPDDRGGTGRLGQAGGPKPPSGKREEEERRTRVTEDGKKGPHPFDGRPAPSPSDRPADRRPPVEGISGRRASPGVHSPVPEKESAGRIPWKGLASAETGPRMEEEVRRMVRRLQTRESLRMRRAKRGRTDLRRTIALSRGTGGVPFALAHRRRPVRKTRLVVLADVSGSMSRSAALFMRLAQAIYRQAGDTRSFVFVDRPVDITDHLRHQKCGVDWRAALERPEIRMDRLSDYGSMWYSLSSAPSRFLDRDTVVLVWGDARSNGFDPQPWAMGDVRERVRSIIWFNPEPRKKWDTEDSRMAAYLPHVSAAMPCGNLEELYMAFLRVRGARR